MAESLIELADRAGHPNVAKSFGKRLLNSELASHMQRTTGPGQEVGQGR